MLTDEERKAVGGSMSAIKDCWCSCNRLREAEAKADKWDGIVRCGECVHAYDQWDYLECERSSGDYFAVEPDHFCAWGIRRESEVG